MRKKSEASGKTCGKQFRPNSLPQGNGGQRLYIESMTLSTNPVTHVLTTLETDKSANVVDLGTAIGVPMVLKALAIKSYHVLMLHIAEKTFLEAQGLVSLKWSGAPKIAI